ncbi:MAG TPA: amino acid adenylation domain-containing protein [Nitrospirales bacterium]|nr:amino acid adenylation domain-containing protein [Nitrospirales bacterium]
MPNWRQRLSGDLPVLNMPLDHPRPPVPSFVKDQEEIVLGQDLFHKIRTFSAQHNTSTFVILLAAFKTLLLRYTGENDVIVGWAPPDRWSPESPENRKYVLEPLIFRTDLSGHPTVSVLLDRVAKAVKKTAANLPYSLKETLEDRVQEYDGDLFSFRVMFQSEELPPESPLNRKTEGPLSWSQKVGVQYDLIVKCVIKDQFVLQMEYDTELLEPSTIIRMLGHYQSLLAVMVSGVTSRICEHTFLPEAERHQLLVQWNQTSVDYPRNASIHEAFEDQVALAPESVAVVFGDCQVTYEELNKRANRLARRLQKVGVRPETLVGLFVERSVEMLVGLLGILKAGGAYVPLDSGYPNERLKFMYQDAGIQILVTQPHLRPGFLNPEHVVCLAEDREPVRENDDQNLGRLTQAGNLTYIMYTSGSTGLPKGVSVEHRAVIRLVKGTTYTTFSSKEVYLHMAPLAFDASTFEIWGALLNGARLVVLPPKPPTLDAIGEAILQNQATTLWLTAGLFHLMVSARIDALKPLRHLLAGGDVLSVQSMEQARRELKGCRLVNGYGPTEGTTFSCCYEIPSDKELGHTVSIGCPIANTRIYILDVYHQPAPIGVRGELYIGGEGLARGYWHQPDLTAEKFVPDPYGNQPGTRLYMTGDEARYWSDGNIEFLGRRDHQVKVRGYRVELGEIEATLEQQPSVRQSIVRAREGLSGDKRLVAYVVPTHDYAPTPGELREKLALLLPEYMIPSLWVFVETFPLTPNGKVDHKALPAPEWEDSGREKTIVTPGTQTERTLAEIWNQLLGVGGISVHDHFFFLGGDSLLAMRLATQVQRVFGVNLSLEQIFEAPTLRGMSMRIEHLPVDTDPWQQSLTDQTKEALAPVAYEQERMWILQQTTPDSPVYNKSFAVRIRGNLEVEALRRSLQALEERHDPLRTTFAWLADHLEQQVHPTSEWPLTPEDLRSLPPSEREDRWQTLAGEEASRVFDLNRGPVWRVRLFQLKDTEHVLLLTFHHICLDEWSLSIFGEELSQLYQGFVLGHSITLPPLPCRYIDYARRQRQELESGVADIQLTYWRKKLGGEVPVLTLPIDYPRPSAQQEQGATEKRLLNGRLLDRLKKLSGDKQITLFMTLLGAFQILLSRYSGQEDIVVGTPFAMRDLSKFQGLMGLFQNTLVLRGDLSGQPTVEEMLTRVRKMSLEAYAHSNVPFQKVVQALRRQQEKGNANLFNVMFVVNNLGEQPISLDSLETILLPISTGTAKFDLTLFLEGKPTGLQAVMEYRTDLFRAETIQRMLGNFEVLLEKMITHPELRIDELPLQTNSDRHQTLVEWNQTAADFPRSLCIHQLVEDQVTRTPETVALVFGDEHLTYGELNRRANQVAHHLQRLGVGSETGVGLYMSRSIEMVIGLLGILKAGGVYVPLDPGYPTERLRFMLQDVKPAVVLTNRELEDDLDGLPFHTVHMNEMMTSAENGPTPFCPATPHHLAYFLFTSGSTGQPKAVAIRHQTLVNLVVWQNAQSGRGAGACTIQFSSLNFDVSLQEIFSSLCGGGMLLIISEETRRDLPALAHLIHEQRVTKIFSPFVVLEGLIQALLALKTSPTWLLEFVTAGEQLRITPSMVQLFERLSESILVNQYGPTEAHVVSEYTLRGNPSDWMVYPPIGRPIANTQLYILDDRMNPVPIGVRGELYISGEGLARGYWSRPGLTAEKFLPHPFAHQAGTRLYKTGDWARYGHDGQIGFLGRRDHQVRIRGYRIELGEIENTLEQHASVSHAIALVRENRPGDKHLVAYIVPTHGRVPDSRGLREALALTLPDYMVPSAFVVLKQLPLTPSGKIDRKALPVPERADRTQGMTDVGPRTPMEQTLVTIWQEVLGLEQVGIHDNFFELGGHSLLATQVIWRLRTQLQVEIKLRSFFQVPTVAGLAAILTPSVDPESQAIVPPLTPCGRTNPLPLSFAQQRLWFLDQWEPNSALYNVSSVFRLRGLFQVNALRNALRALVERHESLRTIFHVVDDMPCQHILDLEKLANPGLTILEVPAKAGETRDATVQRMITEEIGRPFDLTRGPLFRARLLPITETEAVFILTLHHIITDGWSMKVFFKELADLYAAEITGTPANLAALPIQYADYAVWQRQCVQGEELDRQLTYWRTQLAEAPPSLELPTDFPRPLQLSNRGDTLSFTLPPVLTESLDSLSRHEGVTLFMTLLTVFQLLLFRYTGQKDILIGTPIAGRTHIHLEGLIGYFANTLVLRARFEGQPTFQDMLDQVKETCLNAYAHQDLPFEKLVEAMQPVRDPSRHPLFQVMFQLQHAESTNELNLLNLDVVPLPQFRQTAKFDLSLGLVRRGKTLNGTVIFNTELFEPETISRLATHYQTLLEGLLADPSCPVSRLPLLQEAERRQLLLEWNPPLPPDSIPPTVQEMFEAQAARSPDAVAIICEDEQFTYEALNQKVNQVAHYLVGHGVGPEVRVAVCLERSINLLIALLGIVKAGGVYVPLDPSTPFDRMTYMFTDARVRLVLTQSSLLKHFQEQKPSITFEPPLQPQWVPIDDPTFALYPYHPLNPRPNVSGDNLAYIIYTSGSTGQPKGVGITHASLSEFVLCAWKYLEIESHDRVLQFSSPAFDATMEEIFPCLFRGGTLVLRPQNMIDTVSTFWDAVNSLQLTVLDLPTAYWHELTHALSIQTVSLPHCVRLVVIGGEQAGADQLAIWQKHMPSHLKLLNTYGPTEATVVTAMGYLTDDGPETKQRHSATVSIGHPLDNRSIYILDSYFQPMPIGVPGELYLGGKGLGRGYDHLQTLTAESFLPDPFSRQPGARLYRSGDRGRYRANGTIELCGRVDHQIKIRGYRVELQEIESCLRQLTEIHDAVVVAQTHEQGPSSLLAYVVNHHQQPLSIANIRTYLQEKLANFMVPGIIIQLHEFPRLPSGKVDRRALLSSLPPASIEDVGIKAPGTAFEELLVKIWTELLHLPTVDVRDNFFELGGHSLLATRLLARLREICQSDLPLQILFEHPTLEDQALAIEEYLLQEIEELSEDELQNILDDQGPA